jgi:hypothetical protein
MNNPTHTPKPKTKHSPTPHTHPPIHQLTPFAYLTAATSHLNAARHNIACALTLCPAETLESQALCQLHLWVCDAIDTAQRIRRDSLKHLR